MIFLWEKDYSPKQAIKKTKKINFQLINLLSACCLVRCINETEKKESLQGSVFVIILSTIGNYDELHTEWKHAETSLWHVIQNNALAMTPCLIKWTFMQVSFSIFFEVSLEKKKKGGKRKKEKVQFVINYEILLVRSMSNDLWGWKEW